MGTPASLAIGSRAEGLAGARQGLLRQGWFLWPLALRLAVWLFLAHAYEMAVFEDASWRMVRGEGVYGRFAAWWSAAGDGYYAYPPLYAYMLWASGRVAALLGGHWWVHQLLIKAWLVLADAALMLFLYRVRPAAARAYWTLWVVPVVAIGQVQPDLWVGLSVVLALYLATHRRWAAAGFLIALGAGLKPVPLIILPFLVIHLGQRGDWKAVRRMTAAVVAGTMIVWLPYASLFGDWRAISEVIRFHVSRPAAGLTLLAGLAALANAASAAIAWLGYHIPSDLLGLGLMQRADATYPLLTVGVLVVLMVVAGKQQWPMRRAFTVPLLVFLLTNKVVHEHYLLQVLPLLLFLGVELRGLIASFAVYLLAAGTPLRFFPQQWGVPPTLDAVLPPSMQATLGVIVTIGLVATVGSAALAFSLHTVRLLRRELLASREVRGSA